MSASISESTPAPERPTKPRRNRVRASVEAQMSLSGPIANWPARNAWRCALWGLIPMAGLPLGLAAMLLGWVGWRRAKQRPQDVGYHHALGAVILGAMEVLVNLGGLSCIFVGLRQLHWI
ncbi:MAG TPA: hypothetical protein VGZ47_02885 [Gemmataceae bacterium]|jgi:hypothetical protein|nr:hypothetical protein [Gemmataceae bacterium]